MTNSTSRTQRLARAGIAAFAICTCLLSYSASAETNVKSQAVNFADLDLSKNAGVQTLYKRIQAAARNVCGPVDQYTYASSHREFRKCIATAIAAAVAQVDRPSLTALHKEEASRTARG